LGITAGSRELPGRISRW